MYKFLTIYGPTGFTSYLSIKREIIPFKIQNTNTKQLKNPSDLNIVISSVAGGVGLTVAEYLSKLGYKRVFGIAGSD
jgi:NADPH-dependent curcumin reductase CurA